MIAQHLAQRPVEQVRRGVVAHRVRPIAADFERRGLPDLDDSRRDSAQVQDGVAEFVRVVDLESPRRRAEATRVADLAALLGVEVRAIEEKADFVVFAEDAFAHRDAVLDPAEDGPLRGERAELGGVVGFRDFATGRR